MASTRTRSTHDAASGVRDAKEPLSPVAGPYGHPFHPIFVTIPIGAWVAALIFDIASRAQSRGSNAMVEGAFWLIGIGIIGAAVAAIFGLMDLTRIHRRTRAFVTGLTHMLLNTTVLVLFIVNWFWRLDDHDTATRVRPGQLALTIIALLILAVSGWLGGTLSYHFGVRVADETTQAEGFRETAETRGNGNRR